MSELTANLRDWAQREGIQSCDDAADALDAIDDLHQPEAFMDSHYCEACDDPWPCITHRLLHPSAQRVD